MIPYIQTYTGKHFKHTDINEDDICIEDIAHSLSLLCRFTGHSREFYSVAQHSVLVSYNCNPENAFWGLMHDASEAYCADLSRPLKHLESMEEYRLIEHRVMNVIAHKFGLPSQEPPDVKEADWVLLATESRDLFNGDDIFGPSKPLYVHIIPWTPKEAETRFLNRFYALTYERKRNEEAETGSKASAAGRTDILILE